jgi:hypothetical protein
MAKKKTREPFVGRVFWVDPSGSKDYEYENIPNSMERLGYFRTNGLIELSDKYCIVLIHDEEITGDEKKRKVRENSDIPRSLVIKVEEHMGGNRWRTVNL